MDQHGFDSLARSLATARTRRGLIGGVAALVAGARAAGWASAQSDRPIVGQVRNRKGDCSCPPGQDDVCPGTGCTSRRTDPANCGRCGNACAFGEICQKGECRCPDGVTCGFGPGAPCTAECASCAVTADGRQLCAPSRILVECEVCQADADCTGTDFPTCVDYALNGPDRLRVDVNCGPSAGGTGTHCGVIG